MQFITRIVCFYKLLRFRYLTGYKVQLIKTPNVLYLHKIRQRLSRQIVRISDRRNYSIVGNNGIRSAEIESLDNQIEKLVQGLNVLDEVLKILIIE